MLRRSLCAGLFGVLAILLTFTGCSDDPTGNNTIVGDPNSPQFQKMRAAIATTIDSTLGIALKFGAIPSRFPQDSAHARPDLGILNPEDSVLYNYVGGWNVLYIGLTSTANYNYVFVDSARFLFGGVPYKDISNLIDQLMFVHHQTNVYKGNDSEYQDFTSYVNLDYQQWPVPDYQFVQGTGHFILDDYYQVNSQAKHDHYDFSLVVDDMKFTDNINDPWWFGHPSSGSILLTGSFTDGSVTANWTVTAAFNAEGQATIHAVSGNVEYDYSETPDYQ
jgi:hypothetical protein